MEGQSEAIDQLATAMSVAQGQIDGAKKDAKNPHLRSKYADFTAVVEATRPALVANGLAVIQVLCTVDGKDHLRTTLTHKSGQWMGGSIPIDEEQQKGINRKQALGSAISYLRRYSYESITGVARIDDDDGHAAGAKKVSTASRPTVAVNVEATGTADKQEVEEHKRIVDKNRTEMWDRFSNWMSLMQKEKERVGEATYYKTMVSSVGWKKSNEAKELLKKDPDATLKSMSTLLKEMRRNTDLTTRSATP